jgi:hypothetical protein
VSDEQPVDPRPQPRWGQYADVPPPAPDPQFPPPEPPAAEAAPAAPRRTVDIAVTTGLLILGVLDVVTRWSEYANLSATMRELYRLQELGEFTAVGLADQVGGIINIARVVVLVATIVLSLALIQRGRRAFWVPLAGAALAFVTTIALLIAVMVSDPAIAEYAMRLSGG